MDALAAWRRLSGWPGGKRLYSWIVCHRAPYFGSIRPRFVDLRPGRSEVRMADRRAVRNHIGTVHAIAMCNLAELAAGTMAEVTVPKAQRWIPKGMTVSYLAKASGALVAVATPAGPLPAGEAGDYPVEVAVSDRAGATVLSARIVMWVTPRNAGR